MYNWERRAAENLTNADHMREVKRRIDHDYQNQLRRRERERADAAEKREIRVRTPSPLAPQSNKFKTRTYDRPWAQGVSITRKQQQLSCSRKTSISEVRNTSNKGSVSRLPAIGRGPQGRAAELAGSSKPPWRASVPLASHCKGPSSSWPKPKSVDLKNKLPTQGKPSTLKRTQSQDTLKTKTRIKAQCEHLDGPNMSQRGDPVCVLDSHSLPQPLTSPGRVNPDWPRLPSLQHRLTSPEDCQLMAHAFEGFSSENSSVAEEDSGSEGAYREAFFRSSADTPLLSVAQSISSESPPSTRTLESSLSDSFVSPLNSRFSSLDIVSSESDWEDGETASSWEAAVGESCYAPVQRTGSQTSLNYVSHRRNALSPGSLLGREIRTPEPLSRASLDSGYSPAPSFLQAGQASVSLSPAVTERVHRGSLATPEQIDQQLPELELSPRWSPPSWLGSERTSEASPRASSQGRHAALVSRQEETEQSRDTSNDSREGTLSSSEALRPGTSGLMDPLTMALMALHDIRREVAHMQMSHAHGGNGSDSQEAQSAPASDPETLRKIKESLLEESSDEEEDQCRICQSGAVSPTNPLLTPCQCSGSLQYIHHECLKKWIQTKIQSGTTLSAVKTCELCKASLALDLDNFDVDEFYQRHNHTQVEQGSQELYMLLLLQQRFSELLQVAQSRSNAVSRMATRIYLLQRATGTSSLEASTHTSYDETTGHQRGPEVPEQSQHHT